MQYGGLRGIGRTLASIGWVVATACGTAVTGEHWGYAGHAGIEGTVTRSDGSPFPNAPLYVTCGTGAQPGVGFTFSGRSDGTFAINLDAEPAHLPLPVDGKLPCTLKFSRPVTIEPAGEIRVGILFAADPAARLTARLHLRAGVVLDSIVQ